jgi:hypothetical protein
MRRAAPDLRPGVVQDNAGADLGVPDDLDLLALRIVGDAREAQRSQVGLAVVDRLDEPRPPAHLDELAFLDAHPFCRGWNQRSKTLLAALIRSPGASQDRSYLHRGP